jgi:hypothetical protein
MSAALRTAVLAALEKACRRKYNASYALLRDKWVDCDDKAARYGASTREITSAARAPSLAHVRRVLHAEVVAGTVLIEKSYATSIRWWPVGMLEKLQAEAAAGAPP